MSPIRMVLFRVLRAGAGWLMIGLGTLGATLALPAVWTLHDLPWFAPRQDQAPEPEEAPARDETADGPRLTPAELAAWRELAAALKAADET